MPQSVRDFVESVPIVDVHEHHMPCILLSRQVNLLQLFQQSYAGWTTARPYPLPSESARMAPPTATVGPTTWEEIAPFLENSGSNAFVRNLVDAVTELHGDGESEVTEKSWQRLDAAVREHHGRSEWCSDVIRRAGIQRLITDPFADPLLNARQTLGPNYDSVLRINAFALGWHPDSLDHTGNSGHALLRQLGFEPTTFDDYLVALDKVVDGCSSRHQVGLKNALAYDRGLDFDEPNEQLARQAWGNPSPSPAERKAFGDFIVEMLCRRAGERDLPVQMHLGTGVIRGSHPLKVAGLIERNPRTRFLLMHLAYPWSRDLLGLAFVYRNVWLDLTWALLLSPSHFKLAMHEAIEVLPDETRMMIGGDNLHVEETYGTMRLARKLIGEVLDERIATGYLRPLEAQRLAKRIFNENASRFFKLP